MHADTIARIKQEWKAETLRAQRKEHPREFPPLPGVPAGRYTRADFYQLEQERLWPATWLLAGHTSEVASPGSYKRWDSAGMPVIIVRGKDNVIRAFFNVCQHRGTTLVTEQSGNKTAFACTYHGWTYSLEGKLNFVPDEYDFANLDKSQKGLVPLRCEMWGNFIFVNRDPDCVPLRDHLGGMYDQLADMHFENLTMFAKLSYDIDCNWKCVQDAFAEGYHISALHKNTVAKFIDYEVGTRRLFPNGHGYQIVQKRSGDEFEAVKYFDRELVDDDPEHEITRDSSRAHNIFPNVIIPVALTQFPIIVPWATGPDSCRVEVYYVATPGHGDPESEACKTVVQMFEVVTQEDLSVLKIQQAGLKSGTIRSLTLSYGERMIYNYHENLDRVLGLERVPADLLVPQILAPFLEP